MRQNLKIVPASMNPSADQLGDRLFQPGNRKEKLRVSFAVDENPFDPRIGTPLAFFVLSVSRMGGTNFKLRGLVVAPAQEPVVGKGMHKAVVDYDIATRTGIVHIRD